MCNFLHTTLFHGKITLFTGEFRSLCDFLHAISIDGKVNLGHPIPVRDEKMRNINVSQTSRTEV